MAFSIAVEPGRVAALCPPPLEPASDRVLVYLVDATVFDESIAVELRSFAEANLALPVRGREGEGTWFLRAWFDRQERVDNANNRAGWIGRLASIEAPRLPFTERLWAWPPERELTGAVTEAGVRVVEGGLWPRRPCELADTPLAQMTRVYGHLEGRVLIERHPEERITGCWQGDARLTLAGEVAELLGPHRLEGGWLVDLGVSLGGYHETG